MSNRIALSLLGLCVAVYLLGIFCVPLMDIDATQYASMSREMLLSGNFLELYDLGKDYIDKPPMLFWLSSLSLGIFGVHDWAYRLPSFLFSLLALYSTYRLALLFYRKEVALLSITILATCQAMFLINHDVRTDTMLMGWVACSIWQLAEWYQFQKWKNLSLAAVAIAGGMMTKGPLALMIPIFAFGPHFLLRHNFKEFFRWEYLILLIIIAVLLVPMSYGLYQQFDLHPGKVVVGKTIDSGLKFYYWTQSFGRITGDNPQRENGSILFQLQNMVWSFLPWIIFFLLGLFSAIKQIIEKRFLLTNKEEAITVAGFLVTYLALGSSKVQLPHYIFVIFPLAAIITARFFDQLFNDLSWNRWRKTLTLSHAIVFALMWIALILLMVVPFKSIPVFVPVFAGLGLVGYLWLASRKNLPMPKLLLLCFFTTIGLNIFLNTAFYPTLLKFQTGNIAAKFIEDNNLEKEKVRVYGKVVEARNSLFFYADHIFPRTDTVATLKAGDYVLVSAEQYSQLSGVKHAILFTGKGFPVTKLSLKFLTPSKREKELSPFHIVKILP
ncbi:MAG: glycosyltransferase family 39 protein [Ferruginibacter sp.]|nr:glycosyltransferase family 39 protein [Ferruginibacter sp.]